MIKLGFGTTVLEKGLSRKHMDGIGVYAKNLWEAFGTTGKKGAMGIQAVSFGRQNPSDEARKILGGPIHIPLSYPAQSARSIISGKAFSGIEEMETNIDIFFAPDHHIPKLNHTPVIATIMDAYPLIHPKLVSRRLRRFKNMAFRQASKWADHIITISEYSKQDISKYFDIPDHRISVVPLGVNKHFFERIPEDEKASVLRKYGLKEDFFIFVGTIQPRKNLPRLIEAYESLPSTLREKHQLLIIGHYGWGEEALMHKLGNIGNRDTVRWLEYVNSQELYALLQSAAAMVYPSLYEGFGLPVLEGFASEIPVITSSTTSIPEVAADAALYVNPRESKDIAKKMQEVILNSSLRKTMIQKGMQRAKRYSWRISAEKHIEIFKKIYYNN